MGRFLLGMLTSLLLWILLPPTWWWLFPNPQFETSPPGRDAPVVHLLLRPDYDLQVWSGPLAWTFHRPMTYRFWTAWNDSGTHLSLLICNVEGDTIEHLLPGASGAPWNVEAAPGFAESDAALERSLRAHLPVPDNRPGKKALQWFCQDGKAGEAFTERYWPKGTAASTLPSR